MEMKIVKSRPPDIRLKKHAEVKIHKKDFYLPRTKRKKCFQHENLIFLFKKAGEKIFLIGSR